MYDAPKQKLTRKIAELKVRLRKLESLRDALDDEEIAPDLAELFGPQHGGGEKNFDKIKAFFEERDNEWAPVQEISESTDVKLGSVRQVIYKSNPANFENEPHPDGGRKRQFRLATKEE